MKLSKSIRNRNGMYVPGRVAMSGKFSAPANEPPAGTDSGSGSGGGDQGGTGGADGKTFTQADLTRIAAKEKAEGKAAAERAIAEQLGVSVEEAKSIIQRSKEAEDKTKSEAQKEREKAEAERKAAEADRQEAKVETHNARIERALAKLGFTGDDDAAKRVAKMVTVEVGGSYEDILADATALKKTLNPELFGEKQKTPGKGGGTGRGLPNGDPTAKPPAPNGGDDAYSAGVKRFEERKAKRSTFNPLAKSQ
jgi:hypothetical protein